MASLLPLFVTPIYRVELTGRDLAYQREVKAACLAIAAEDRAGQAWSREHDYKGYTSYASLNDLTWRSPVMGALAARIARHVGDFCHVLDMDLGRSRLQLDSLWINVLDPGGHHAAHIHPHSVVSGTYYVDVPKDASSIRFEDPRLALMMAAPPRKAGSRLRNRTFMDLTPRTGTLLLWESWLRHEVLINNARRPRISVSFNYRWG